MTTIEKSLIVIIGLTVGAIIGDQIRSGTLNNRLDQVSESCTTDTECQCLCERQGGTDCHDALKPAPMIIEPPRKGEL